MLGQTLRPPNGVILMDLRYFDREFRDEDVLMVTSECGAEHYQFLGVNRQRRLSQYPLILRATPHGRKDCQTESGQSESTHKR